MMTNLQIIAQIRLYLTSNFDCILKIDAIKEVKNVFGNLSSLRMILDAYESIDKFN